MHANEAGGGLGIHRIRHLNQALKGKKLWSVEIH